MSAILDLTAFTIHPAVYLRDADALEEALSATMRDEDVVYIVVAGTDEIITQFHGERASPPAMRRTNDGAAISADGSMYEGMKTIHDGRSIARLYVGMSLQRLKREIRNARIAVVLMSVLVLGVGVLAVIGISTYLTRPLRAVAATAESITSGRTRERVRIAGSAEVRRLSMSFNTMIDDVELRASDLQRSHDELRRLSRKLLSVQEEERVTISREIHDELGHALTILKMDIRNFPADRIAPAVANSLCSSIDSLIELVRRIAAELRPLVLDDLGLQAALEHQVRRLNEKAGLSASLVAPQTVDVDQLTASTILRIVREALANVVRHAAASTVEVRLSGDDQSIRLEIRDNGRGIDPARVAAPESLGLVGIRERALLLGGHVSIESGEGKGTLVRVILPVSGNPFQS
ncbi:MAG TPA: ATP-binding protein [Thermoanaerobaculia bacterium]|nr:ATP-binding protein [Thermoanaerobaculia bacterium]